MFSLKAREPFAGYRMLPSKRFPGSWKVWW
jgi:hypothetical protein